jgi:hypothetical protein
MRGVTRYVLNARPLLRPAHTCSSQGFALWARSVAPVLPALRARYAGCGCRLTTSILLRCARSILRLEACKLRMLNTWVAPLTLAYIHCTGSRCPRL